MRDRLSLIFECAAVFCLFTLCLSLPLGLLLGSIGDYLTLTSLELLALGAICYVIADRLTT